MTTSHLIAGLNLSLLCDINSNYLIYAGAELVAVSSCKHLNVNNNTVFAVRHFKRGISNLSCLLAEDCAKKSFFTCKVGFALGSNLTNKDVAAVNFGTDTDNTVFIQILESVFTDVRNISCDFLGTELSISCLLVVLYNMDRSIYIVAYYFFINKYSVLVVVTFPGHKADKSVLTERDFTVAGCGTVCDNLTVFNLLVKRNYRALVDAGALV